MLGPSARAVLKLTAGSATAQVIGIAAAPILTRIYTPAEFGALSVFLAITTFVSIAATGSYEQAIMLPREDREATELAVFAIALSVITTTVTLFGVLFAVPALSVDGEQNSYGWLYFLPPMVLMTSIGSVLLAFSTRLKMFNLVATTSMIRAICQTAAQLSLGALQPSSASLVASSTIGVTVANMRLYAALHSKIRSVGLRKARVLQSARNYSRFPRNTLPAVLLNSTSLTALPLFIGAFFGAAVLGVWSLAMRMLTIPLTFVGQSVTQVYYRRAVEVHHAGMDSFALYSGTVKKLALISIAPFTLLAIVAPSVFEIVFGPEWSEAGIYARIMIPWLWVRFLTTPVAQTTLVFHRNRLGLLLQATLVGVTATTAAVSLLMSLDFNTFLLLLSISSAASYGLTLLVNGKVAYVGTA